MKLKYKVAVILLCCCLTGLLVLTNLAVTPKESTWEDVLAEAEKGGYKIITSDVLIEKFLQNKENLLIVDTRQDWEYRTGHIKGALNFPMEPTWWARWQKKDKLKQFLGSDKLRFIVFY